MDSIKKILKIVLATILILIIGFSVYAFFLPKEQKVYQAITIKASDTVVYDLVHDFRSWESWHCWQKYDTTIHYSYSEKSYGLGAIRRWESKQMDAGSNTMSTDIPYKKVGYKTEIGSLKSLETEIEIFKKNDKEVELIWREKISCNWNPFMKFIIRGIAKRLMAPDIHENLEGIKKAAEEKK